MFEVYATPALLQKCVLNNQGTPLDVHLPTLAHAHSRLLPWWLMGTLQALGSIALLFLFALSIVPAWYVGDALVEVASIKIQSLGTDATFSWVFLPIAVPMWMVSFLIIVVLMKILAILKRRCFYPTICVSSMVVC